MENTAPSFVCADLQDATTHYPVTGYNPHQNSFKQSSPDHISDRSRHSEPVISEGHRQRHAARPPPGAFAPSVVCGAEWPLGAAVVPGGAWGRGRVSTAPPGRDVAGRCVEGTSGGRFVAGVGRVHQCILAPPWGCRRFWGAWNGGGRCARPPATPTGVRRAGSGGLACGAARGLGRAVVMKLVVCRSRGRNEFGFIENMCCGF